MATLSEPPLQETPPRTSSGTVPIIAGPDGPQRRRSYRLWAIVGIAVLALCAIGLLLYHRGYGQSDGATAIPTATVERGDVAIAINAKGELRGGNPQSLAAPMTGGTELHITRLLSPGEPVKPGDVVVQFDTAEQVFKLAEAKADLAEAEQNLAKATAQRSADAEEDRYALAKAQSDVRIAELDVRKNPLLPAITARENDLALEGARDHLRQVERNGNNRKATGSAGIQIQEAARTKALSQSKTAEDNIKSMTLRADRAGYVSVKDNTNTNWGYEGMVLPIFQEGDTVRPGMAIAEIPDLHRWEMVANIGELDQGHLKLGQKVSVSVLAEPNRIFHGAVKELGGLTGPMWNRHFECTASLDDPSPGLRPGMSARIEIDTERMRDVLSVPAQALFEVDGRTFVYLQSGRNFAQRSVSLLRRSETRAVITGLTRGEQVALVNPAELAKKQSEAAANPLNSVGK